MTSSHKGCAALPLLFVLLISGCAAKQPGKVESGIALWTKHYLTVGGRDDRNPIKASEKTISEGREAFGSYCAVCHGLDGQNTGVPFAISMAPPVPSLASQDVQSYTDGQLRWIIVNGLYPSGMPAAKDAFSDDDVWQMVLYIRNLPKQGSLGIPRAYGGS